MTTLVEHVKRRWKVGRAIGTVAADVGAHDVARRHATGHKNLRAARPLLALLLVGVAVGPPGGEHQVTVDEVEPVGGRPETDVVARGIAIRDDDIR